MNVKNLNDWLQWQEQFHYSGHQHGLENIKTVANVLNCITFSCPVITIGGTNGKGSCAMLIEAILREQGYRVGCYLSPHLIHYNERFRIKGELIDDGSLCHAFSTIEAARNNVPLTYFEFATLAALLLFQKSELDIVILEVGVGGRWDAVNIVDSDIAVITTIDLDHMHWLGNSRDDIAKEKAGIFRANKPIVCGDPNPPSVLLQNADQIDAEFYCQQQRYTFANNKSSWDWECADNKLEQLPVPAILLQNAATSLMVIHLLQQRLVVSRDAINNGLSQVAVPGRQQMINGSCLQIIDIAHNPQATSALADFLSKQQLKGVCRAVVAMMQDKDIENTLLPMLNIIDEWYIADLQTARGKSAEKMQAILTELGAKTVKKFSRLDQAYQQALGNALADDCLVLFGSCYVAGELSQVIQDVR